jgi:hypothetical protein
LLKAGEIDITHWTVGMPIQQDQKAFNRMSFAPGNTLKMLLHASWSISVPHPFNAL